MKIPSWCCIGNQNLFTVKCKGSARGVPESQLGRESDEDDEITMIVEMVKPSDTHFMRWLGEADARRQSSSFAARRQWNNLELKEM